VSATRVILVHYHEISLKRGNRPLFLRHLQRNLARALADLGPVRVHQLTGRIAVELSSEVDAAAAAGRAARVFGIANLAVAERVAPVLPALTAAVDRAIEGRSFASFRITARRAFKSFPMTSIEMNRALGAHVLARRGCKVDLEHPECTIHVEVLPDQAYVYADRRPGPGGLPVGASGLVTALLSGGIDSPVAAWRLMKRGCRVDLVHFHSVPYLPDASIRKARELAAVLTPWQGASRLFVVPFGEVQREVVLSVPAWGRVVVYRRLMVRIAEALARRRGAGALVTGESLGQVASQTLDNLARIGEAATLPVLRPLIGMDKLEITAQAQAIGTFEISIEPDADCCTLFVPKHPNTRIRADEVAAMEAGLDVPALVAMAVGGAVEEHLEFPPGSTPAPAVHADGPAAAAPPAVTGGA
jgi:thiamine biosynthesis protein ThiI